jgi:hypothetical protein
MATRPFQRPPLLALSLLFSLNLGFAQDTRPPESAPVAAAGKPSQANAVNEEVKKTVENLKTSISSAIERLDKANQGSHDERVKELDALIADVKKALAEVSEGGQVYDKLATSIKVTDQMVTEVRTKMTDPTKTTETQTRYQKLMRDAENQKTRLYQSQMAMNSARHMLEDRVQLLDENKELVVDYARLEQLEEANEAIISVVKNMNTVTEELDKLVSGIAAPTLP